MCQPLQQWTQQLKHHHIHTTAIELAPLGSRHHREANAPEGGSARQKARAYLATTHQQTNYDEAERIFTDGCQKGSISSTAATAAAQRPGCRRIYPCTGCPATTHMVEYMRISKYPVRHDVKIDSNNFSSIPKLSFFFPEYCS